jgi:aryl-alcohol dehydrogenase-like predicted oxidoreductase
MRRRVLGRSGLQVSELALGTWGLAGDGYGPVAESDQDEVIDRALDYGINLFETADVYGNGAMEKKLGQRLADVQDAVIVTKIGTDLDSKPKRKRFDLEFLKSAFEKSRERLRRDKLDVVLLHNPSPAAIENGEVAQWLQGLVDAGQLRTWGISAGSKEVISAALSKPFVPHVVELAVNVFCSADYHLMERDLAERNIAVLARSVLAHGLLAGMWPADKTFAPEDHRSKRWTGDQLRRRIHQLKALRVLNSGGSLPSMRAAAVAYVLQKERIASAVLGPRNAIALDQLVRETPKTPPYIDERARQLLQVQLAKFAVA